MGVLAGLVLGQGWVMDTAEVNEKYGKLLIDDEKIEVGFKIVRDCFIFTDKRLLVVDVKGLTGTKVEYISLPYKSIVGFSVESAGILSLSADLKIWIDSWGEPIVKKFDKNTNIYDLQKMLAEHILS
ncbi:MAG TPA: PH domain-containing protein [Bacteroidales bacterium]|nr:PH domain-containing protein [Bacteroidales bacterium]